MERSRKDRPRSQQAYSIEPTPDTSQYCNMVKPIPDAVKDVLGQLTAAQQATIRGYIATLRAELKTHEEEALTAADADPHAHYHGHDKCTSDHGHGQTEHEDAGKKHDHKEHGHEHKEHKHEHTEHCDHKDHHEHKSHDHKEHDHKEHKHEHTEHCDHKDHDHKEHKHEHKKDSCADDGDTHKHGHDHQEHVAHDHHDHGDTKAAGDDVPAWKKAALGADPASAPFGGNWNSESNVSASKGGETMEE